MEPDGTNINDAEFAAKFNPIIEHLLDDSQYYSGRLDTVSFKDVDWLGGLIQLFSLDCRPSLGRSEVLVQPVGPGREPRREGYYQRYS
jgi:hypothetical protein